MGRKRVLIQNHQVNTEDINWIPKEEIIDDKESEYPDYLNEESYDDYLDQQERKKD